MEKLMRAKIRKYIMKYNLPDKRDLGVFFDTHESFPKSDKPIDLGPSITVRSPSGKYLLDVAKCEQTKNKCYANLRKAEDQKEITEFLFTMPPDEPNYFWTVDNGIEYLFLVSGMNCMIMVNCETGVMLLFQTDYTIKIYLSMYKTLHIDLFDEECRSWEEIICDFSQPSRPPYRILARIPDSPPFTYDSVITSRSYKKIVHIGNYYGEPLEKRDYKAWKYDIQLLLAMNRSNVIKFNAESMSLLFIYAL